jgi:hypothetical protein
MTLEVSQAGAEVWRKYVTDAVPASGLHSPDLDEAQAWARDVDAMLENGFGVSVLTRSLSTPPGSPATGARYIVGAGPSGSWSTFVAGDIAEYDGAAWSNRTPATGNLAYVVDEALVLVWATSAWSDWGGTAALAAINTYLAATPDPYNQLLTNPDGRVFNRATATNADDTFGFDRWNVLTQTAAIACSQALLVESGTPSMMRLTQSQASAQRFGQEQIYKASDCQYLRGRSVTLSGRVRCSASTTIKYAILEWTGTADSVTSDVVNDWTDAALTAGHFFLGSNLTVAATGSLALTANTLTDLTALTAALSASLNNLIVLLWTSSTQAQNVTLDMALALHEGTRARARARRALNDELARCRLYYQTMGGDGTTDVFAAGACSSSTAGRVFGTIPEMQAIPTLTISTAADFAVQKSDGTFQACTGVTSDVISKKSFSVTFTVASGLTAGNGTIMRANATANARIKLEAEL